MAAVAHRLMLDKDFGMAAGGIYQAFLPASIGAMKVAESSHTLAMPSSQSATKYAASQVHCHNYEELLFYLKRQKYTAHSSPGRYFNDTTITYFSPYNTGVPSFMPDEGSIALTRRRFVKWRPRDVGRHTFAALTSGVGSLANGLVAPAGRAGDAMRLLRLPNYQRLFDDAPPRRQRHMPRESTRGRRRQAKPGAMPACGVSRHHIEERAARRASISKFHVIEMSI